MPSLAVATAVNEEGQGVGSSSTGSRVGLIFELQAFLWDDRTIQDLGTPGDSALQPESKIEPVGPIERSLVLELDRGIVERPRRDGF